MPTGKSRSDEKTHTQMSRESRDELLGQSGCARSSGARQKKKNCVTLRLDYSRTWRDKTLIEPPYILRSQVASSLDK